MLQTTIGLTAFITGLLGFALQLLSADKPNKPWILGIYSSIALTYAGVYIITIGA